jgi:hypothetical protein
MFYIFLFCRIFRAYKAIMTRLLAPKNRIETLEWVKNWKYFFWHFLTSIKFDIC